VAVTYRARFLAAVREMERRMAALFASLAASAAAELLRHAGADGAISASSLFDIQTAIGLYVTRLFLGQTAGGREAFTVLSDGTVYPLSPYARALFAGTTSVEQLAVTTQQTLMARALSSQPAALSQLRAAHVVFTNPLATYDPVHRWVDPGGFRLSDRIWRTSGQTRRRLDMFLEERIRQGQGALPMSRDLERFLQPGRTLRTKAPYGTDASYDAMRLARTEITRAHSGAFEAAANANPFVKGLQWNLSGSHPKTDVCDDYAAGSPYTLDDHPILPAHPQCLCYWTNVLVEDKDAVIRQLAGVKA
jgi:hypothetical protein